MSEEAFKYRVEALTDDYGRFKFEKQKPGKYYLETIVSFTATGSYQQQTGTTDAYNGFGNLSVFITNLFHLFLWL